MTGRENLSAEEIEKAEDCIREFGNCAKYGNECYNDRNNCLADINLTANLDVTDLKDSE